MWCVVGLWSVCDGCVADCQAQCWLYFVVLLPYQEVNAPGASLVLGEMGWMGQNGQELV